MGDTQLNVPVDVRSHELDQLLDWTPQMEHNLRAAATEENGLGEQADTIGRIYQEHVQTHDTRAHSDTPYVSMPADDWWTLVRHLDRLYDSEGKNRVWWLKKKLASRLRDQLDELDNDDD